MSLGGRGTRRSGPGVRHVTQLPSSAGTSLLSWDSRVCGLSPVTSGSWLHIFSYTWSLHWDKTQGVPATTQ